LALVLPPRSTLFPYTTLFRSFTLVSPFGETVIQLQVAGVHNVANALAGAGAAQALGISLDAISRGLGKLQPMAGRGKRLAGENRSEEHTSELQSRENLVCRLL